jgi:predicted DNA-binding transcriptional regulator YafY
MTSPASTTARLLRLLSLLQTRRDWPGTVLADRLEISARTVRRDVDRLRELGYRIHATMGPDGGYRLDVGTEMPPLLFDDDQIIALTVALQAATMSGVGIEESALRALTTMRQVMPSRLRHRLDAVSFVALTDAAAPGTVAPEMLLALSASIRASEVLRFDYTSVDADASAPRPPEPRAPRRVEPHHLVVAQRRWYLVAWDLDRGDWRVFRADRITPRAPGGARFTPREVPGGDVREFVAARFKGSDLGDAWPCRGTVILDVPASAVLPFATDGIVVDLGDGRCRVELGSWSWVALAASFGRFDAAMEVVGPPELEAAFGELAARYAAGVGS